MAHTVKLTRFAGICRARPQYGSQSFSLLTTYPSRELSDESLTLKDASLLNATVMQRIK